jgi:hypothetical protein
MKTFLACVLMMSGSNLFGSIVESISFDLSLLHPGSTLSGTFALSNSPAVGDSTTAVLSFSDPADYSPSPVTATIGIGNGTSFPFTVTFAPISFTNLSGSTTPINTKNITLTAAGMAQCASFPCTANGRFQANDPALFAATYSVAPAATGAVPEPGYAAVLTLVMAGLFVGRRAALKR